MNQKYPNIQDENTISSMEIHELFKIATNTKESWKNFDLQKKILFHKKHHTRNKNKRQKRA